MFVKVDESKSGRGDKHEMSIIIILIFVLYLIEVDGDIDAGEEERPEGDKKKHCYQF